MVARDRPPFVDARVGWLVDLWAVERIVLKSADEIFESKQSFPGTQHAGSPTGLNGSASHLGGRHAACGRRRMSSHRLFSCGREPTWRELQRGTVDAGHTPPLSGPGPDAAACMQVVAIKMRTVGSFRSEPAERWVTTFLARFLTRDSAEGRSSDFGE